MICKGGIMNLDSLKKEKPFTGENQKKLNNVISEILALRKCKRDL